MRQRLQIVREYLVTCLNACPPGKIQVISVCAGDSRDLTGTLYDHPRTTDVQARLVELDERLVECGRTAAESAGLGEQLQFIQGDATISSMYEGAAPADIVLLCGVIGNIPEEELPRLMESLAYFCKPEAFVIWTRDLFEDGDRRLELVRELLQKSGFEEVNFRMTLTGNMGVGTHRYHGQTLPLPKDKELFVFSSPLDTQDAWPLH